MLDSFQVEVLNAFFELEQGFFLTGGAALAGFHLGHRPTKDLDLFTAEDRLEQGVSALRAVAERLGATIEEVQTAATFRRFFLGRDRQTVVVDLVRDLVPQIHPEKKCFGQIRVDLPEEIFANKLCAILSRSELRDLVDIYTLEKHGFSIDQALRQGFLKDGGLTAGQLAWVLSEIELGDDAKPPGNVTVEELRRFLETWKKQLAQSSFPS